MHAFARIWQVFRWIFSLAPLDYYKGVPEFALHFVNLIETTD